MKIPITKYWLYPYIPRLRTFVDIGAFLGEWAKTFHLLFERIVVFEPLQHHMTTLFKDLPSNVEVVNKAAYSYNGRLVLKTYEDTACTGIHLQKHIPPIGKIEVDCITLDSLNLEGVDFINIDAEGSEWEILQGSEKTIIKNKPHLIIENHISENSQKIEELLSRLGYSISKVRYPNFSAGHSDYDGYFWFLARHASRTEEASEFQEIVASSATNHG